MRRLVAAVLLATLALAAIGCGDDDESASTTTLTLDSKARTLYVEDNPPKGSTSGDQRSFTQGLITEDGKPAGRLDGSTIITSQKGKGSGALEYRIGTVQYTLDGGTIVIGGVYTARPGQFIPAAGVTRPIVGGSGKYEGADGQVTQTPLPNGEIRSVLEIQVPED